jgi:hypothetical protein
MCNRDFHTLDPVNAKEQSQEKQTKANKSKNGQVNE